MKIEDKKMLILERLVKEGHITLCEAFELSEKEYITNTQSSPITYIPFPNNPLVPPYTITCDVGTGTITSNTSSTIADEVRERREKQFKQHLSDFNKLIDDSKKKAKLFQGSTLL